MMQPLALPANTLASFYSGAGQIGDFRHDATVDPTHAEDWIASTITRFRGGAGRTVIEDGTSLADLLAVDPEGWFGPDYLAELGPAHVLLTKLLDAGTRLPLHVHPDRPFARAHLGSELGKTEAWLVLHADAGASARLGFTRDVSFAELSDWVARQDVEMLLRTCNEVAIKSGDVIFCPAGVPHSIGAGLIIDDLWASIGSDNVNRRSWTHDSELSCAVIDEVIDSRAPQVLDRFGHGARAFARNLRLELAREHLGRDSADDGDLVDPVAAFDAFDASARALQAWIDHGRVGPRPRGQLRPYAVRRLSSRTLAVGRAAVPDGG